MQGYDTLHCSHTDVLEWRSLTPCPDTDSQACVAHALQDCSFTIPTCTSVAMNSKAGVHRCKKSWSQWFSLHGVMEQPLTNANVC